MSLKVAASSDTRALAIRDHVLPLVREHGSLQDEDSALRLMMLERGSWKFVHWTPFNALGRTEPSSPAYRHALQRQHTQPDMPYGLNIQHKQVDVLSLLWADDKVFKVLRFLRGSWEASALEM